MAAIAIFISLAFQGSRDQPKKEKFKAQGRSTIGTLPQVNSTTVDLTAGVDYRVNRNWTAGFLFGYAQAGQSDYFAQSITGGFRLAF